MVSREITDLVNRRLTRLLTIAEASMSPNQFRAFRKLALDEFGWEGLRKDLVELERQGTD